MYLCKNWISGIYIRSTGFTFIKVPSYLKFVNASVYPIINNVSIISSVVV